MTFLAAAEDIFWLAFILFYQWVSARLRPKYQSAGGPYPINFFELFIQEQLV